MTDLFFKADPKAPTIDGVLTDMFRDLKTHGKSEDIDLRDLFKDGTLVDEHNFAILDDDEVDTGKLDGFIVKHVNAAAVNWAWHDQRVWLMSYPMTQQECKYYGCLESFGIAQSHNMLTDVQQSIQTTRSPTITTPG